MEGFIVLDFTAQYGTARQELAQWLAEGKIQRKETIVKGGLAAAEQALLGLFEGINTGTLFSINSLFVPHVFMRGARLIMNREDVGGD
jgi:NADPH-dependent curcumin reductase CurA